MSRITLSMDLCLPRNDFNGGVSQTCCAVTDVTSDLGLLDLRGQVFWLTKGSISAREYLVGSSFAFEMNEHQASSAILNSNARMT
jgi:predicted aconitase with swiveling domain